MRPHNTIHRSLTSMTVGLQQRLRQNQDLKRLWGYGEREQQFQFPFNGTIGLVPVETTFKILFDHIFAGDAGYARDSQLGEPVARFGFRIDTAPAGTVPYAHVSSWIQDDDQNFIGANVLIGAHNPAVLDSQATYTQPFTGLIHCTFQGYGGMIDNPGDILAGADDASGGGPQGVAALPQFSGGGDGGIGGPTGPGTGTGVGAGTGNGGSGSGGLPGGAGGGSGTGAGSSQGGGGPVHLGGGSSGAGSSGESAWQSAWDKGYHMPKYPSGPLGGSNWTRIATWEAGGSLGAWDIPEGEGALRVANDTDGRLTCKTPYEVTTGGAISYGLTANSIRTTWSPPPGARWLEPVPSVVGSWVWYLGDKYAARWTAPGAKGDNHKIRMHILLDPIGQDTIQDVYSVVVNLRDRSTGLAFWWSADGVGWVTDLRKLGGGPMDLTPGRKTPPDSNGLAMTRDSVFTIPRNVSGRQEYADNTSPAVLDDFDKANPPLDRFTPEMQYAQLRLGLPHEVWVEVWRDGLVIHAAIYEAPPENGATPSYMSDYQLRTDDPNFGPNINGYFGWTISYMTDGKNSGPNPYDPMFPNAHSWPYDAPQRGIKEAMLFRRGS